MSGEGHLCACFDRRPGELEATRGVAKQGLAILAHPDGEPWRVRLIVTGAEQLVQLDLTPRDAERLATELVQMAELARNPGMVL